MPIRTTRAPAGSSLMVSTRPGYVAAVAAQPSASFRVRGARHAVAGFGSWPRATVTDPAARIAASATDERTISLPSERMVVAETGHAGEWRLTDTT